MDEAREIFGDEFDFKDINFDEVDGDAEEDEDLDEDDEELMDEGEEEEVEREPEYDEDGNLIEDQATLLRARRRRAAARRRQKAEELFEPEEIQRGYLTENDVNIRRIDNPERFQVKRKKRHRFHQRSIFFVVETNSRH